MADVSRPPIAGDERGNRGQLILVGGLVVAIGLVALVLLLNTVLFAENIATRGIDPGGERAHDHAEFAEHAGVTILRAEDRPATEPTAWPEAKANVTADVARVASLSRNRSLQHHRAYTNVSVNRTTRGAALLQNASGAFENANGNETWTLADTQGIRRFTMTVDAGEMTTDTFEVEIEGVDGSPWRAEVNSTSSNEVRVTVAGTNCTSSSTVATINWTAGTLGDCSFPFAVYTGGAALEKPLTLRFVNGSNGHGTYFLVVKDKGDTSVVESNFAGPGDDLSPRWYPVAYSLFLDVFYEDVDVTYETTVRAAPGEPPQTRPEP